MLFKIHPPELRTDNDTFGRGWRGRLLYRAPTHVREYYSEIRMLMPGDLLRENPWRKWFAWLPVRIALIPQLTPMDYYPAWRWVWLEAVEFSWTAHWTDVAMSTLTSHYKCNIYPRYRFITKEE